MYFITISNEARFNDQDEGFPTTQRCLSSFYYLFNSRYMFGRTTIFRLKYIQRNPNLEPTESTIHLKPQSLKSPT
jgi:hypothetical protein